MPRKDGESDFRIVEIAEWFAENRSDANDNLLRKFMEDGVAEVGAEIADIRRQISDEDYRLLPLSYMQGSILAKATHGQLAFKQK